ncbi:hypothetical protein ACTG9Q_32690 [Actinokineospora sp. 24-640]
MQPAQPVSVTRLNPEKALRRVDMVDAADSLDYYINYDYTGDPGDAQRGWYQAERVIECVVLAFEADSAEIISVLAARPARGR